MNYSPIFTIAARTEDACSAVQHWIANDAPIVEQRIKVLSLKVFIAVCEFAIATIDRRDEYKLQFRLAVIRAKRFKVRQEIKFWSFVSYNGLDTKASALWANKGAIAVRVADRIFCLD